MTRKGAILIQSNENGGIGYKIEGNLIQSDMIAAIEMIKYEIIQAAMARQKLKSQFQARDINKETVN